MPCAHIKEFTLVKNPTAVPSVHSHFPNQQICRIICHSKLVINPLPARSAKSDLKKHVQGHTCGKSYRCSQCSRPYSLPSRLKRHVRAHTGCTKTFPVPAYLWQHLRVHINVKSCSCSQLRKSFTQMFYLHRHLKTCKISQGWKSLHLSTV